MAQPKPQRMFESEKIGFYLDDIRHRMIKAKGDDGKIAMVDLSFRMQPLTPALAGELDDRVKRTLFRLTDGEAVPHVGAIGFKLGIPQQDIAIHTTPDTKRPKFLLSRCDISKSIKARADADMPGFVLTFRASYAHPSSDELAYFHEGLYSQHFLTFVVTDPALALEPEDDAHQLDEDQEARELEAQRLAEQDEAAIMADETERAGAGGALEFETERRQAVDALDPGDARELTTELDPGVKARKVLPLKKKAAAPATKTRAKVAKKGATKKTGKKR